ncbi:MAG TPA: class I SAM-dependent methyltransferase [Candidatus Acidoferrales bacterium]|nr:class I SAM-dependent methyltransferase [Candidatus Acidoferrales bacterium]
MEENISHWYDGLFYDLFVAPHQDEVFALVKKILIKGSTVLDVGCGTGRMASQILNICERIEIIDPSAENIAIAKRKLKDVAPEKLFIRHIDALTFLQHTAAQYDFAVVSYMLHEIAEEERDVLLWGLSRIADKIIIIDYLVPEPKNYCAILNRIVEWAAGSLHYRNFKSFVKASGILGLLEKVPLNVLSEVKNRPCSSHIAVLEGKTGKNSKSYLHSPIPDGTKIRVKIDAQN